VARQDELTSFITSPPINQYARNALRFPIELERFISSGASPGCGYLRMYRVYIISTGPLALPRASNGAPRSRKTPLNIIEGGTSESGCGPGVFINWIKGNRRSVPPCHLFSTHARPFSGRRTFACSPIIPIDRVFSVLMYTRTNVRFCVCVCVCVSIEDYVVLRDDLL